MRVIKLDYADAPPEWAALPDIAAHKPLQGEIVLKRLGNTDVCAWFARSGMVWVRRSDLFLVDGA